MTGSRAARFAAPLSFLLPGLGQAALGRRRRGVLLALPAIAIAGVVVGIGAGIAADPSMALDLVPGPEAVAALLALEGALLAYHLAAILDAERLGRAARPVRGWIRVSAALVLSVVVAGQRGAPRDDRLCRGAGRRRAGDRLRARRWRRRRRLGHPGAELRARSRPSGPRRRPCRPCGPHPPRRPPRPSRTGRRRRRPPARQPPRRQPPGLRPGRPRRRSRFPPGRRTAGSTCSSSAATPAPIAGACAPTRSSS